MEDDFVGAIKIKDGLFIGDEYAAQDFEFVVTNKVTHIINCAGKQIPNYWETVGVAYLTYDWMDSENQIVFDTKGEVVNEIFNFIEEAVKLGEGVLVHSLKGQSRSCCVLTAYFMKRYRWSLYKTLEFLTSRRSDLEIRTSFYHQLLNLESRLFQQVEGQVTVNWFEVGQEDDNEELLLRNTFLNARSAPFDEALVNPQPGADTRLRKLNWVDEKTPNKSGLTSFLSKESSASRLSKSMTYSVKSILKGSNKVFKMKSKTLEDENPGSSNGKVSPSPGLRMHKSVRNFSEGRPEGDATPKQATEKSDIATDKYQDLKNSKTASSMMRSSSATYFEREDNAKGQTNKGAATSSTDKIPNAKVANINGNIIHLTVNNYLAPVNNVNATAQANEKEKTQQTSSSQSQIPRPASVKFEEPKKVEYESTKLHYSDNLYSKPEPAQQTEKSTLSTNQLKYAIEKKLSKEYKSQLSSTSSLVKPDFQAVTTKTPSSKMTTDNKPVKVVKEISKPNDLKVNYQVLLKNRETPPPRKREDGKKIPESPLRKANSKSSLSNSKGPGDSTLPYSSYLNSLFSTSFSHLNTVTPSAYASNYTNTDKKTPISTKATPLTYNLTLSQKAQALTRPQRITANQTYDKNYDSSGLNKQKIQTDPSSASNLTAKYNNYLTQTKANPVRVTYEKIERPHSATPDRSATPQSGLKRVGTASTSGQGSKNTGTPDQRLSVPTKTSNTKHAKKDSGSTQDLLAKYRQRSSSPSQLVGYTPSLSSSLNMKTKAKY